MSELRARGGRSARPPVTDGSARQIEFGLLGSLMVRRDGRELRVRGVKQRALLAILLVHANEHLRTARLIDDLWGESPPATATKAIQVYVSQLRKTLGPEVVETHANGYLLRLDPGSLDLKRFEELVDRGRQLLANGEAQAAHDVLREALGLWRGEALTDVVDEGFARDEIARLTELRLLAVEERIRADLALGRHVEVASELERLIKAHPLRESLRGLLMVALYRAGRQADALDVYKATRAELVEVGLEPVDELRSLEKAILRHDRSLDLPARAVVGAKRTAGNGGIGHPPGEVHGVRFGILGPIAAWNNGSELRLGGSKRRAVLAVLLLRANEVVSTEKLFESLWGARPPLTAKKVLQVHISRLRKVVGEGVLVTRPTGYMLKFESSALDADRFERLLAQGRQLFAEGAAEEARGLLCEGLALWRGPALADFRYDDFARNEIGRLEELRLVALEQRLEADLALGHGPEAVAELEALVRDHPLRERLCELLMTALYRTGRQADALAAYQNARVALLEERGLDPSQSLQRLERAVLTHDPSLDAGEVGVAPATSRPDGAASGGVLTYVMWDVEIPTALRDHQPEAMAAAVVRERELIDGVLKDHGGRVVGSARADDRAVSVFDAAIAATHAAVAAAQRLGEGSWLDGSAVRARFCVHSAVVEMRAGDHSGPTMDLVARIHDEAAGGEILLSETTAALAGSGLPDGYAIVDLGPHHLKGIRTPETVKALTGPALTTALTAGECPYRGLLAFEPRHRHLFFGREEVLGEVLARIEPGRLLAVVGASGSGKSSLLQAGVLGPVQAGELACARSARLITPGAQPSLDLGDDESELLIFDQFEELYTQCDDAKRRARFIEALLSRRGAVVIGVRADFYGALSADADLAAAVTRNQVLLGPMRDEDLRRAIAEPARLLGLRPESGLIDLVLRDVAGEPGALPLMSHALRETWVRRDGRTLTVEAYRESGGVSSAVAQTADALVETTPSSDRLLLRNVFLRLTEIGDDVDDARRRVPVEELVPQRSSRDAIMALLERLARARLVILDEGTVELAHEVLIRRWPTLRRWLDEDRQGIRLHRRLGEAARLWDAAGREPADLYRGTRLDAAVEWAGQHGAQLNGTENDFVNASVEESARTQRSQLKVNRRLRRTLAAGATFLVAAVGLLGWALVQRSKAIQSSKVATSLALAADSTAQQTVDPELSVLLAVQAAKAAPTGDAMLALRDAIDASPVRRQLPPAGTQNDYGQSFGGDYLAYSPDGRWLAESSDHGPVVILDAATRRVVRRLRTPWPATLGARSWSPDGKLLAVMTEHAVFLVNTDTGAAVASIPAMPYSVGVAFGPDGTTVYGAGQTQAGWNRNNGAPGAAAFLPVRSAVWVGAWDIATRRFRRFTTPPATSAWAYASVQSAALSPDGRRLAVGAFPGLAVFDTATGRAIKVLAARFQHDLSRTTPFPSGDVWVDLAYSPDGLLLAGADTHEVQGSIAPSGTSATVLNTRTLRPRAIVPEAGKYQVATALAFSPDGTEIAYGDHSAAVAVYSLRLHEQLMNLPGLTTPVVSLAFSPDGTTIASATKDGQGWIWRTTGNEQLLITPGADPNTTTYAALLRDRVVATLTPANGVDAGKIVVESWSRTTGRPLTGPLVVSPLADPGAQASFSSDGRYIAVSDDTDKHVEIWDIPGRRIVARFTFARDLAYLGAATDWSPGDRYLAIPTFGRGHLWIWDRQTGRLSPALTNPIDCNMSEATAWSPNGALLAETNSCGDLWIIDTATRHTVYTATGLGPLVTATSFSPDSSQLILTGATAPDSVGVIDVATGRTVLNLLGGTAQILSAFFSADGSLIASSSADGVARIWDADTGQLLRTRPDVVGNGAISDPWGPDSSSIVTVDGIGNIRVFDACADCENPAALLALAASHVNRQLTPDERLIYHIA